MCASMARESGGQATLFFSFLTSRTRLSTGIRYSIMSLNDQTPGVSPYLHFILGSFETTFGPPYPSWYD